MKSIGTPHTIEGVKHYFRLGLSYGCKCLHEGDGITKEMIGEGLLAVANELIQANYLSALRRLKAGEHPPSPESTRPRLQIYYGPELQLKLPLQASPPEPAMPEVDPAAFSNYVTTVKERPEWVIQEIAS